MKHIICFFLIGFNISFAQKLSVDSKITFQTIHSFGASDCWSMQMVGKYYPIKKREKIAELLFSKELDHAGNPKGIGLSMWRFNVGAGSSEQGIESKISNEWRRAECFLENGTYDWNKQQGQQWFLAAAKRYKVDFTLGFLNSSPVFMNKNGLAIGNGKLGDWNFDKTKIKDFTTFLAEVSEKFDFDYLSPFNEPQWDWGSKPKTGQASQEGTPINNDDIAWAIRKIDTEFTKRNIKSHLILPEAGQIDYLYQSKTNRSLEKQDNQIEDFFELSSPNFIGNLKSVDKTICGHSYFTTSPVEQLVSKRKALGEKIKQQNINYWQSEYCILGNNAGEINGNRMDLGMKMAMYVAKVIHADLTYANASAWHWWLSVSANDFKDGLIYVSNNGAKGENDMNKFDGEILESKSLWVLGNYARFIRPKMQRIEASIEIKNVLVSAYKSEKQIIIVLINSADNQIIELPIFSKSQKIAVYTTSQNHNLKFHKIKNNTFNLSAESVTTVVITY